RLCAAGLPLGGIPKTRRVRRQNLIGKDNAVARSSGRDSAELELRVRQDQPTRFRVLQCPRVNGQREPARLGRVFFADQLLYLRERNILVVGAFLARRGRRKDRLGQPRSVQQTAGQRNAA